MKKKFTGISSSRTKGSFLQKAQLTMKLTVLFMLIACLQVSASVNAQRISYSKKKASFDNVFKSIRKQTGYEFLYNSTMLKNAKIDDLDLDHLPLEEALEKVFKGQPLTYSIIGKTIVVRKRPKANQLPTEVQEPAFAEIHGTVMDSVTGEPLVGVTVKVKGSSTG